MGLLPAALAALSAVCAVGVWALLQVASALRREAAESRRNRTLAILRLFSTGQSASQEDPRALLTWQPLAMAARKLCPAEFAELDRAFGSEFTVLYRGEELGRMRLAVPGRHNILNALAAVAVAIDLKIEFEKVVEALAGFRGADRRFQMKGEAGGVLVVDDYGHHPTEIQATLEAAASSGRRVVALFQPHRYSRTQHLMEDFGRAFYSAAVVFVADIYAASEEPIEGVTGERLAESITQHGHRHAEYVGSLENAVGRLASAVRPGDLVLTLGAGNVHHAGDELLKRLEGVTR